MRTVLLTGDSLRHFYIATTVAQTGWLAAVVIEEGKAALPEPPPGLRGHVRELFIRHFRERAEAERVFFGARSSRPPEAPQVRVSRQEMNSHKVWAFLEAMKPDLVLSYGVAKFDDETIRRMPTVRWNIHAGLSPWYRGSITHFWPSYLLQPHMTGMTLHELTSQLDGGPIVHQCPAPLVKGDGIHELACRAVKVFGEELPRLLQLHQEGALEPAQPQRGQGKLWRQDEWRPEHLTLIYDLYENRIVDARLEGQFTSPPVPPLVRQFKERS